MKHPLPTRFTLLLCLLMVSLALSPALSAQEITDAQAGPCLVGTYPLPGDVFDRQIVFYFDQPLAPVEDPSTLIHFEPPLAGTWTQGEKHVALMPHAKTRNHQKFYRATFMPTLTGISGLPIIPPDSPVFFADFRFSLKSVSYSKIGIETTQITL
ncbi:MAG: hypothetical protein L3K26_20725, partial [Candidatus Hydrogenedentes bacterium]|nr:hypothetical protein [Candidatus Hydrogenedentota bacterium]